MIKQRFSCTIFKGEITKLVIDFREIFTLLHSPELAKQNRESDKAN